MSTIAERIKQLRKSEGLTQQRFADRLGLKQNTVATYEMGRSIPIDPIITSMCREFSINEDWLRYGTGQMQSSSLRDTEIENFMNTVLRSENESFRRRLISALTRLNESEWELLESMALKLAEETQRGQESFWQTKKGQDES